MPLTFDMPFEQLKTYTGTNPKPHDFDEYWSSGLQEMRAADPKTVMVPAEFSAPYAECFDMYFTGVRNARIHVKYVRPKIQNGPAPAVLNFHGYTGNAGDWFDKLPYAAAGFHVFAMDCRGQGGTSEDSGGVKGTTLNGHIIRGLEDNPHNLLFRHIFLDTARLAEIVMGMEGIDAERVGAFGGSQGGALTLACASLVPEIKRLAPQFPFLSDYKRVWDIDLANEAYRELSDFFRKFDPRHEREEEIFLKLGYIDIQHLSSRIKGNVLMFTGLMDQVCPPSTQFAAYNKITSPKKMVLYPDFGHENLPEKDDLTFAFLSGM